MLIPRQQVSPLQRFEPLGKLSHTLKERTFMYSIQYMFPLDVMFKNLENSAVLLLLLPQFVQKVEVFCFYGDPQTSAAE